MCRRINSLSRKVRISVLRFRKFSPKFWFGISFHALKFSFLPEFLCLPFFFDLTRFLTVAVLPFASSILGLSIYVKHQTLPHLLSFGQHRPTTLFPRVSQVPNLVPRFSHLPAPWNEVAWSLGSCGRFQQSHKRRLNARFSKSKPHRRYRR